MGFKISKTNDEQAFFHAKLDQIPMSGYERLKAKAQLARAEAIAEALLQLVNLAKRLVKVLVVRPYRRLVA